MRYSKINGFFRSLWHIRWLVAWGIPYCLLTKRSQRRNEWRWSKEELEGYVAQAGFIPVSTEEVPYTHVGCALGVFRKALLENGIINHAH
jgi:hypothetical protein